MGLHLNYELRLPADLPQEQVRERLALLREFAALMPMDLVTPLLDAEQLFSEEAERKIPSRDSFG
jgi:hypothetical protein